MMEEEFNDSSEHQVAQLASAAQASGEGQVEWLSVREHVMARPDMYIGRQLDTSMRIYIHV